MAERDQPRIAIEKIICQSKDAKDQTIGNEIDNETSAKKWNTNE
jgi:hypothetical protein